MNSYILLYNLVRYMTPKIHNKLRMTNTVKQSRDVCYSTVAYDKTAKHDDIKEKFKEI